MASTTPLRLLGREKDHFYVFTPGHDRHVDDFHILSYRWGEEVPPWRCDIPGVPGPITLSQGKLEDIKSLMITADIECLWIDAICIDQTNSIEKNTEIAKMYEYYRSAQQCHVLLDVEEAWSSEDIVEKLTMIDTVLENVGGSTKISEAMISTTLKTFLSHWAERD